MKKTLIMVLVVMLSCTIFSTVAMATPEQPLVEVTSVEEVPQETEGTTEEPVDPGILPDSPFYFLKRFIEEIKLAFTFSPDSKAAMLMEIAEVRIAELEALPEEKQAAFAESLTEAFVEAMEEVEELLKEEELEEDAVDEAVYEEVYKSTGKSLEVLQRVYKQVPDQAKKGIQRAIDVKLAKLQGLNPGPNRYAPGKGKAEDRVEEKLDEDDISDYQDKAEDRVEAELEEEELDEDDQISDYQDKVEDVLEKFEDVNKEKEEILEEIKELQDELTDLVVSGEVSEEDISNLQDSITAQINLLDQIDGLVAKYSGMLDGAEETVNEKDDLEEVKEAFDAELDILLEEIEKSVENLEEALEEVSESIEDVEDDDDDDDNGDEEDVDRKEKNKKRR